jgi:uncharacterized protein YqfA (UPF0365 family)
MPFNFDPISFALGVAAAILTMFVATFSFGFVRPYLRGFLSGAPVSLISLIGMRLRGSPVNLLLDAFIALRQAGFHHIQMRDVESLYLIHRGRIVTMQDLVELVRSKHPLPDDSPKAVGQAAGK